MSLRLKKYLSHASLLTALVMASACSRPAPQAPEAAAPAPASPSAEAPKPAADGAYKADLKNIQMEWTAFKTTEKVPVKGSFSKFQINGKDSAATLLELIQGLNIEIDATSVKTDNPARDATLSQFFFVLIQPPQIKASVVKASGDDLKGDMTLKIDLNGVSKEVPFTYTADAEGNFQAQGSINLMDFNLKPAFESLHKACEQLHTGPDGVAKTWEQVDLTIKGAFKKPGA